MREIKFRGKQIDREWVYGDLLRENDNRFGGQFFKIFVDTDDVEDEGELIRVDGSTIGQFTGLKDKNGMDIYEGDIVNLHLFTQELGYNMGVSEGEKEMRGIIYFEELGLAFKESEVDEEWFYLVYAPGMIHEESFEVIGNVHQNPELLNK